ncbi:BrxA/BrxB family bacilliredoxin [Pueribacillus theae]|uniref:BrxA/BrxB family bacilliredoxin n=1 Tax=Pueribacillus theae TaxID=2171751 RepID=A0A2U1K735_9BACI|nr:BrxA/BrxB family bacilliredoxin [Pueribacillus theae]PWA13192.1 BrxA/BrxB family bacilliredoxin [Pueribacillus theae]
MDFNLFMKDIVDQARREMRDSGYTELTTPEEVDEAMKKQGTTLVMVNSTCGCAGGVARPAAYYALKNDKKPDHLVTVFAGQDREATEQARTYFTGYPPSSPSFALMKDGKIVEMIARNDIESFDTEDVVKKLQDAFNQHC